MKNAAQILNDKRYRNPRVNSPTREIELAVKAAREDVCMNILFVFTVLLFVSHHWIAGIVFVVIFVFQALEATSSELALRAERRRLDTSDTDVDDNP